jgi:hypothetical protein
MQLRAVILVLAVALGGCATTQSVDRGAETAALARQLGIAESGVTFVAKCQFVRAPKGATGGPVGVGSCFFAQDALHIRVIDATTGKSAPYGSFGRSEIETIALYEGFPATQMQVRLSRDIVAIVMKPDSGLGSSAVDTKALFDQMFAVGYMGFPPGGYISGGN